VNSTTLGLYDEVGPGHGGTPKSLQLDELFARRLQLVDGARSNHVWTCIDEVTGAGEWRPQASFAVTNLPSAGLTNVALRNWTNCGQITWRTNALYESVGSPVFISFSDRSVQWLTLSSTTSTSITLATTNRHVEAHRTVELWLSPAPNGQQRRIDFPPEWRRFSGSLQNVLPADKLAVVRLRLLASGGDESTVAVWWEPQR
jgi:hypothetical protein